MIKNYFQRGNQSFSDKIYAFDYCLLHAITNYIDPSYMENEDYESSRFKDG